MKEPTLDQLSRENPNFFSIKNDRLRCVVRERGRWVLKLVTLAGTRPVYGIKEDLSLEFLRHD